MGLTQVSDKDGSNSNSISKAIDMLSRLLSQKRMELSIEDRNAVEEEIHGVRCRALQETPELISDSLQEFRRELDSFSSSTRNIYDRIVARVSTHRLPISENQNKHYAIEDDGFRLRFLRCELFDAKKAVERFLEYLNLVEELWGFEIVSRRLVVKEDFNKDEIKFLRDGYIQLLPFRDRSGRRIVVMSDDPLIEDYTHVRRETRIKCYLYVLDMATRYSAESQHKGIVWLTNSSGMRSQIQNLFPVLKITPAVPTRIVAGHHYLPDSMAYRLLENSILALHASGAEFERIIRHKFYIGRTQMEMKYDCLGIGIPIRFLPYTETGFIKSKYWKSLLKCWAMIESGIQIGIVECPGTYDVIFRHGQSYRQTQGNEIFREWIESEIVRRKIAASSVVEGQRKGEHVDNKTSIDGFCDRLIYEIEVNQKGRFLKWVNQASVWVRMNDLTEIKKKISASFYNYSKRNFDSLSHEHSNIEYAYVDSDSDTYRFIDRGKRTCPSDICSIFNANQKPNARKKPRDSSFTESDDCKGGNHTNG